jgi:hypothetical protein
LEKYRHLATLQKKSQKGDWADHCLATYYKKVGKLLAGEKSQKGDQPAGSEKWEKSHNGIILPAGEKDRKRQKKVEKTVQKVSEKKVRKRLMQTATWQSLTGKTARDLKII